MKRSIPGCDKLAWRDDEALDAEVRARIGPVDTRFKGRVTLSERDPPNGYRLTGEGQGGAAGFASGSALVRLLPADGGGTRLRYDIDATVGGKLAQIGSRLIDAAAHKFADEFFERFAAQVAPTLALAEPSSPAVVGSSQTRAEAGHLGADADRAGLSHAVAVRAGWERRKALRQAPQREVADDRGRDDGKRAKGRSARSRRAPFSSTSCAIIWD